MIGLLIFILGLAIAGVIAYTTREQMFEIVESRYGNSEKFKPSWLVKPLSVLLLTILIGTIQPFAIEKIDAGNKGLKVNLVDDTFSVPTIPEVALVKRRYLNAFVDVSSLIVTPEIAPTDVTGCQLHPPEPFDDRTLLEAPELLLVS